MTTYIVEGETRIMCDDCLEFFPRAELWVWPAATFTIDEVGRGDEPYFVCNECAKYFAIIDRYYWGVDAWKTLRRVDDEEVQKKFGDLIHAEIAVDNTMKHASYQMHGRAEYLKERFGKREAKRRFGVS